MKQKLTFPTVKDLVDYLITIQGSKHIEELGATSVTGVFGKKMFLLL